MAGRFLNEQDLGKADLGGAAGLTVCTGTATVGSSGGGTPIDAVGTTQTSGAAALTAAAALAASGLTQTTGAAAMTAAAALAASGTTQTTGTAALTGSAGVAATGLTQTTGASALTASAGLVATGTTQTPGAATLQASFPIVATGTTQTTGSAALAGAVQATGSTVTTGAAVLTAAAALAASGLTRTTGAATVTSSAAINATGTTQTSSTAVFAATPVTASGTTRTTGTATLTASAALTAAGLTLTTGSAAFSGSAVPNAPDAFMLLDDGGGRWYTSRDGKSRLWYNSPFQRITYRSILGDKLLDYWHSEQDVTLDGNGNVQAWAGQVRGFVFDQTLDADRRPFYGADAAFGGRNVVQCRISGPRCLVYKPGSAIFSRGDRPGLVSVARYVTVPSGAAPTTIVNMGASTAPTPPAIFVNDFFDGSQGGTAAPDGSQFRRAVVRTTGHFTPFGRTVYSQPLGTTTRVSMRALGLTSISFDVYENGKQIGSIENNENLNDSFDQLTVGAQTEGGGTVASSDSNIAMVFLLRNMCTAFEAMQLFSLAQQEWSLP